VAASPLSLTSAAIGESKVLGVFPASLSPPPPSGIYAPPGPGSCSPVHLSLLGSTPSRRVNKHVHGPSSAPPPPRAVPAHHPRTVPPLAIHPHCGHPPRDRPWRWGRGRERSCTHGRPSPAPAPGAMRRHARLNSAVCTAAPRGAAPGPRTPPPRAAAAPRCSSRCLPVPAATPDTAWRLPVPGRVWGHARHARSGRPQACRQPAPSPGPPLAPHPIRCVHGGVTPPTTSLSVGPDRAIPSAPRLPPWPLASFASPAAPPPSLGARPTAGGSPGATSRPPTGTG